MEDIEDLILSEDYFESTLRMQRESVIPKVRRRNKQNQMSSEKALLNGNCSCSPKNNSENCCKSSFSAATSCDPDSETSVISCIEDPSSRNNLYHKESEKNGLRNNVCHSSHCCNGTASLDDVSPSHSKMLEEEKESRESSEVAHHFSNDCRSGIKLDVLLGSNIPGLARVYVHTWGCAHNSSDSEYMAGQLAAYGYDIVENKEEADLWLLNSCTVKSPAEHHLRNEINAALSLGKKVVVAGCVSQGAPRSEFLAGLSIVGVQQIDRVVEVVEETLKGNSVRLLGTKKQGGKKQGGASLQLPKIRRNPLIEIISINTGCLNQCTYCKTKHARGQLGSYPIEDLVSRAEQSFLEGVVEVWLTSEDTGAYGRDIGTTLPELLRHLLQAIPPGCKLRLGMTNPPYILDHLEDMADILNDPRVYKFLHVPVQSGSDNVLWDMKREYTCEQFCTVVDTLRERVPGLTIATDIICGYPTESEEDFEATMTLCRRYRFPSLFINQYFPRPGTPAARLPRIHPRLVKERTKKLSEFFQSYSPYDHKLNETQSILVTEESHDKQHWVGHNDYYEQVLVPKEADYLGKTLRVVITETGKHYLKGRVLVDEEGGEGGLVTPALCVPLPKGAVSGVAQSLSTTSGVKRKHGRPSAAELVKQETYIIVSFVVLITALIARLAWICWRMADA